MDKSSSTRSDRVGSEDQLGSDEWGDDVADSVDDAVDDHPWLEKVTSIGWGAKAVVYGLMGLTAVQIARQDPLADDASPEGSLGRVAEAPFGRLLVALMAVGLLLYCVWRLLSVAVIRGNELSDWGDRIGYTFSAIFYGVLCWTAANAALRGTDIGESNTIERVSRAILDEFVGRVAVGVAGTITIVVGLYFGVYKGIMRKFEKDLRGVSGNVGANRGRERAVLVAGIAGWIGRGVVTGLVGFFVARSAVRYEPDDARGFDQTLRHIAGTSTGSMLVWACAIGLLLYGIFCFLSIPYRELEDNS